ncbi:hypothetical protein FXB41_39980 [Bradyrhizobium canariense]|uniref:hypothetical protein n=1 Tax=Bradyrhizobium canariense TaxID=255045 RepID=UPI001CA518E4|nr:hypothetical protein [Bradyrhizobium canariense]MBW5440716.1 hypothetical protein [Bradyrhizobium canariense]
MEKSAAVLRIRVVEVIVNERWTRRALRWQGEDVGRLRQGRQAPLEIGSNIDITDGQVANNDVADPIQAQPLPFDCSGRANADHRFEGVIFAGDAIAIARADLVWIDHNRFHNIGRQMIAGGFGPTTNIRVSWNDFDGSDIYSSYCNGEHYWNLLFLGVPQTITIANNYFRDKKRDSRL